MENSKFHTRNNIEQIETGSQFAPEFDKDGLIPCITVDSESNEVLMFAWMNREALSRTMETGKAVYYSRSRKCLWVKGESSGRVQDVEDILVDCDQDVIQLRVKVKKEGACHRGYRSCFYRKVKDHNTGELEFVINKPSFDPDKVYE